MHKGLDHARTVNMNDPRNKYLPPSALESQQLALQEFYRSYDVHPDGQRIAAAVASGEATEKLDHVTFIFNFFDELRRIAPPAKK